MKIDILKHTIINTVKSLSFGMKKSERKFIRTILENMLEYKTTVLSQLGDTDKKSSFKPRLNNLNTNTKLFSKS